MSNSIYSSVTCNAHRIWDERAPWLITVYLSATSLGFITTVVQTRAVVDDFGSLIAVEAFR